MFNQHCFLFFVLYGHVQTTLTVQLVGKWVNKEGKDTIEFFKEGTVCVREYKLEVCGNYRFVDDNRIRVRFGNMGEIEIYNISISNNELIIFFSNGESDRFRKF